MILDRFRKPYSIKLVREIKFDEKGEYVLFVARSSGLVAMDIDYLQKYFNARKINVIVASVDGKASDAVNLIRVK